MQATPCHTATMSDGAKKTFATPHGHHTTFVASHQPHSWYGYDTAPQFYCLPAVLELDSMQKKIII
jgi:hypothetical protein